MKVGDFLMEFQLDFKFLNFHLIQRKNSSELPEDEKQFAKVNLLDRLNNPCAFMVFDKDVIKKLTSKSITPLATVLVTIHLSYINNFWNVRMIDISAK